MKVQTKYDLNLNVDGLFDNNIVSEKSVVEAESWRRVERQFPVVDVVSQSVKLKAKLYLRQMSVTVCRRGRYRC